MALRDSMRDSATQYLRPGEPVQAVIGAQTSSQWLAALTGIFRLPPFNRYRILAVTPTRIVVLDAGRSSMKKARGVVTELPRSTRLGPGRECGTRSPRARRSSGCTAGSSRTCRSPTPKPPPPDRGRLTPAPDPAPCGRYPGIPVRRAGHGRGVRRRPAPPASPQPASVSSRLCSGGTGWCRVAGGRAGGLLRRPSLVRRPLSAAAQALADQGAQGVGRDQRRGWARLAGEPSRRRW